MEWIHTSQSLPPPCTKDKRNIRLGLSEKVLVVYKNEVLFAEYNTIEKEWIVFGRTGSFQVSYWLPIPELPKC